MISFNTNSLNRNNFNLDGEEESFGNSISRKKLKEKHILIGKKLLK